jgi:di/tricarboxylate transporter
MTELDQTVGKKKAKPFGVALMLGIAYACNIGGTATTVNYKMEKAYYI